ncbi:MAG: hypothetical protein AB1847_12910 [bacterium]
MEILSLQPEQRVSRTQPDQVDNAENVCRALFLYTCPVCGQETDLTDLLRDDDRSSPLSGAGAGPFHRLLFDRESRQQEQVQEQPGWPGERKEIRDFRCSGCSQPVRMEYSAAPGSADGFKIVRVLEIVSPSFPSKEELLARLNRVTDLFYSLSQGQPPSAFPYLWHVALILFPLLSGNDNSQEMAKLFFQEKEKFDAIIGWSFAWEWIGEDRARMMPDELLLWLAMILRCKESVETTLVRMLKVADLLQQKGLQKSHGTLAAALTLALENCSNEEILTRCNRVIGLRKSPLQGSDCFYESTLMMVLTDDSYPDHLRHIKQAIEEKNLFLSPRDCRSASLLLSLQAPPPVAGVDRFMELGDAFNLAMTRREESLIDPAFFPDESHPFQKVVLSLLNEFSPAFPFDSACFPSIALLCALPWKAEDLARESIGLYHYLRSYRKFISPVASFGVSTGLILSAWEDGNYPCLLLFWFLASIESMAGLQLRQEAPRTLFIHRV